MTDHNPNIPSLLTLDDTVFHVTSVKRASAIMQQGLIPDSNERGDEHWQMVERECDSVCPDYLQDLGLTRREAVFAYPYDYIAQAIVEYRTRQRENSGIHLAILAVRVVATDVYIADAVHLGGDESSPDDYWDTAIALSDYRNSYNSGHGIFKRQAYLVGEKPHSILPDQYIQPEVLIAGPVNTDRIDWLTSSVYQVRGFDNW